MSDDWVDFFVLKILLPLTTALLVVFLVIGLIAAISGNGFPEQRMYKHCIEDGNTDYYCYHMTHTKGGKYD